MRKKDRESILKVANNLSDNQLESYYYECLEACLGSEADVMVEMDFDIRDILARRQFEKFLSEKCSLVESVCIKRGIKLFNEDSV